MSKKLSESIQKNAIPRLDIAPDRALFGGYLDGLLCTFHENERPLHGLAGLLDWRLQGLLSSCIRKGMISGKVGECAYFPIRRHGAVHHLILAGAGSSEKPGARGEVPAGTLALIRKNMESLKLQKIGISRSDFGGAPDKYFTEVLKGVPLWIVD